jgi:hypothetical protein
MSFKIWRSKLRKNCAKVTPIVRVRAKGANLLILFDIEIK